VSESIRPVVAREGVSERRRTTGVHFADVYRRNTARGRLTLSFELFPPRSPDDDHALFEKTLPQLMEWRPAFFTVTYGAGGSTRDRTLEIASRVKSESGVEVAAHLACVGSTAAHIETFLHAARDAGIENIVAIRGDKPKEMADWTPGPDDPRFASDLVRLVKRSGAFGVAVGGYPEGHSECVEGREVDWVRTKEKVDAGADVVITQLFYDNADYYSFESALRRHGVGVPIVPGVLPILSTPQIKRFTALCGAKLPSPLLEKLEQAADDPMAAAQLGVDYATEQCRDLLANGAAGFHFYTLNRASAVTTILERLDLPALPRR
jgi:methylenetetrahydrofolate reductase (NADPH)